MATALDGRRQPGASQIFCDCSLDFFYYILGSTGTTWGQNWSRRQTENCVFYVASAVFGEVK